MTLQANQLSSEAPQDEPAHIDILRGEIGALLGFGDNAVTNEQEQLVEAILQAVQKHYRASSHVIFDVSNHENGKHVISKMIEGADLIKSMEIYDTGPLHCVIADGNMDEDFIDESVLDESLSEIEKNFALYLQRELTEAERFGAWAIANGWMKGNLDE